MLALSIAPTATLSGCLATIPTEQSAFLSGFAGSVSTALAGDGNPISTNLRDATFGDPTRDIFRPPAPLPLASLRSGPQAPFVLRAGSYSMAVQSYCLRAGTHGPGGGDGYLYAPPQGTARELVMAVARNSVFHPQIPQRDIQALLWAILARTKLTDLSPQLQAVGARLLAQPQILELARLTAIDFARDRAYQAMLASAPPALRALLDAEATLRTLLTSGGSFADMERVAVLSGVAPRGPGSLDVPSGRWSRHPEGYWVRYLPRSYSATTLDVFVEPNSPAVGKVFDPAAQIAVPGNTARQRLLMSARALQT